MTTERGQCRCQSRCALIVRAQQGEDLLACLIEVVGAFEFKPAVHDHRGHCPPGRLRPRSERRRYEACERHNGRKALPAR